MSERRHLRLVRGAQRVRSREHIHPAVPSIAEGVVIRLPEPEHVNLRGNRRVLAEQLADAVRARDAGAMQQTIARLARLGVKRGKVEQIVEEAQR